jgi:hypothetical protein
MKGSFILATAGIVTVLGKYDTVDKAIDYLKKVNDGYYLIGSLDTKSNLYYKPIRVQKMKGEIGYVDEQ